MGMTSQTINSPPATHVLRPERRDPRPGALEKIARKATGRLVQFSKERKGWIPGFIARVNGYAPHLESAREEEIKALAGRLRNDLHLEGFTEAHIAHAFALIREVASRSLGMRHFDTQLVGGRVLLNGMVAEMETGEGKTLTATLAAGTAALAGIPVHVITVNDYLTQRDAEWMGPIYSALGLRVGCAVHETAPEEKRAAYGCDITYCTNKEITFDYLRDLIALGGRRDPLRLQAECLYGQGARVHRLLLRGLHFGIIDEADSILIDESRTPLIISKPGNQAGEQAFMEQAMALAGSLETPRDYRVDEARRKVSLTDRGKRRIRKQVQAMGPLWTGKVRREEIVRLALTAMKLFKRDEQYLVQDGKVQIVDEFTGRLMPDRSYEQGLHQLIEVKEGCDITQQPQTQARISYQRFFKRYLRLAGMTGTAREVKQELWSVYGLPVIRIPTHRRVQRKALADRIFPTEQEKWAAVARTVRRLHREKRPVLVGTRSVAASEKASSLLTEKGLAHQVLNAKQDAEEAQVISNAGQAGVITIATNMAGRGTDIGLGSGVLEKGGLHVVLTERHEAGRIDRQLAGRCARLGDPGSYGAILSLEDPLLEGGRGGIAGWAAKLFKRTDSRVWTWLARHAILRAQKKVERLHAKIRKALLREDERRGDMLSFSGRSE